MGKAQNQIYVSILSDIKTCLALLENNTHMDVYTQLNATNQRLLDQHINVDQMCAYNGDIHHNRYVMDCFYLALGECYDFALGSELLDVEMAKKYYTLSNQPPAKWRLGKLYLNKKLRYDGDVDVIAFRLIRQAIESLMTCNHRYFNKRLEYLYDMYTDIHHNTQSHDLYFDILQWIIDNQSDIKPSDHPTLYKLLEMDVACQTPRENNLIDKVNALTL